MRGVHFVNIEKASSYLVKWKMVCIDKGNGGLDVRSFSSMNMALLCLEKKRIWLSFANRIGNFAVERTPFGKLLSALSIVMKREDSTPVM